MWQYGEPTRYDIAPLLPNTMHQNVGYQVVRYDPGSGNYYLGNYVGDIATFKPNSGTITPIITGLGDLDGMFVYQAPTAQVNSVDWA
ncbi:MAG TPA: hypothetical protein VKU02_12220 [Gemmataceae bacterium]|nr:hypothetical protein [Gemmataceae bacterium]